MVPDAQQRLACYDRENGRKPDQPAPEAASSDFRPIGLTDLKTDIAEMRGQKIEVEGRVTLFGGMVMLTAPSGMDTSPVLVEIQEVSREQRRAIIDQCRRPCQATVRGAVGAVMMQPGIIAKAIVLQPAS